MKLYQWIVLTLVVGSGAVAFAQSHDPNLAQEKARMRQAIDRIPSDLSLDWPMPSWGPGGTAVWGFGPGYSLQRSDEPGIQRSFSHRYQLEVDGTSIEVANDNGELTVRLNGDPIDETRVRQNGPVLEILNEDGTVLRRLYGVGHWLAASRAAEAAGLFSQGQKRPTIGVRMEPVSEVLAYHLDLDGAEAVLVSGVVDDQPAATAGLERFDVIIGVDGTSGITMPGLRAAVAGKSAGDSLDLSILRRGRPMTIRVVVAETEVPMGFPGDLNGVMSISPLRLRDRLMESSNSVGGFEFMPGARQSQSESQKLSPDPGLEAIEARLKRLEKLIERLEKATDQRF